MHYDHFIIGQGLAGSLLAWRLLTAGRRVLVIDNGNVAAASRVAAGLVNPVTGKRLVREPKAETYLAEARACYGRLAGQFGVDFFHDKPMLRLFDNDEIKLSWAKRNDDDEYRGLIGEALGSDECGFETGGFIQYQTGYLLTSPLLNTLSQWFKQQTAMLETEFSYADLQFGDTIRWQDHSADGVIFCEGARVINNPWFRHLPMQPSRGDILTLQTDDPLPTWIINSGQWLLPLENGLFKVGATYDWPRPGQPLQEKGSLQGREKLLSVLHRLAPTVKHYQLVEHRAGIRPNSKDKRPLIGFHTQHPRLAVFNGFGSKGSMLIPYYARHFADVLLTGGRLDTDVDIKRWL